LLLLLLLLLRTMLQEQLPLFCERWESSRKVLSDFNTKNLVLMIAKTLW
jgi:hypothetical protein